MIGCYLHEILAESERLDPYGCPILIDQIQQLLCIAAYCPRRHRLRNGGNTEETDNEHKDGRQSRLRGAAILRGGASAATVESHYLQASADKPRA